MEALKSSVHNEFVKIDNFVTNNQDRYETNEDKDIETFDKKHGSKYNAPVEVATHRFRIHEKDADKITGRGDSKEDKKHKFDALQDDWNSKGYAKEGRNNKSG